MKANWFWRYGWIILIALVFGGRYLYFKPKYIAGASAPDFEVRLLDGGQLRLSDLRGKYVLLEFWGSWCGPCRKANPGIVRAYRSINGPYQEGERPFEIISIGIETDSAKWLKAIRNDDLEWPYHASSVERFRDPVALLYGVREIPTGYLINPEGRIMAHNPDPETIISLVGDRLN